MRTKKNHSCSNTSEEITILYFINDSKSGFCTKHAVEQRDYFMLKHSGRVTLIFLTYRLYS